MKISDLSFDPELVMCAPQNWTSANLPDSEQVALHLAADILQIGGYAVIPGTRLADAWLCRQAVQFIGQGANLESDINDTCHSNCMTDANDTLSHYLGYALSADGLWHEHSWLVQKDDDQGNRVIETTGIERIIYYGVRVDLLPSSSMALLEGEMLDNEDTQIQEQAERDELGNMPMRSAGQSRVIIQEAANRRPQRKAA